MSTAPGTVTGTGSARREERLRELQRKLEPIHTLYPYVSNLHDHDGVLQHYVDEGPRDGEVCLALHGNPTWSFLWRRVIHALATDRRVIAPDHVGCGLSDKPGGYAYRLEQHIENLVRLIDHLELDRITLILHDWGGLIGFGLARRRPERIARIVIANTAAYRSQRIPLRIAACRVPVFGKLAVQGLNAFARLATHMAVEKPLERDVKQGFLLPYDSWDNRRATHAFVEDIPLSHEHPSWDELVAIEMALPEFRGLPMQILWGERDWCFTPLFRDEWQRRFPEAEVVRFEKAGHYLFEDAGPEAVKAIRDFLDRHPVDAPSA